jgi:hypothetical protein
VIRLNAIVAHTRIRRKSTIRNCEVTLDISIVNAKMPFRVEVIFILYLLLSYLYCIPSCSIGRRTSSIRVTISSAVDFDENRVKLDTKTKQSSVAYKSVRRSAGQQVVEQFTNDTDCIALSANHTFSMSFLAKTSALESWRYRECQTCRSMQRHWC